MILVDFGLAKFEDGILTVTMTPPTDISGWDIDFLVKKRFGGDFTSGLIMASVSSGLNNQSGINITNSGEGVFNVTIPSLVTSGLDPGNYACTIARTSSGSRTVLDEGYLLLSP